MYRRTQIERRIQRYAKPLTLICAERAPCGDAIHVIPFQVGAHDSVRSMTQSQQVAGLVEKDAAEDGIYWARSPACHDTRGIVECVDSRVRETIRHCVARDMYIGAVRQRRSQSGHYIDFYICAG